ncbi:DUF4112 domain-containing protein [Halopseudomonas nanhaiensis]|uniref:DUF4112 domain-containing protein n=1 Tax=Halopseudomonas nanhaiensis TaxID=2830842 RepID=UPI001CBD44B7|nr:DUF4112 domain-containing protein [Halopseudomonas nanhaiensis]UAW99613.1 DUF4112 domain-containing protein [Halopseudomonas nanhaiensis]
MTQKPSEAEQRAIIKRLDKFSRFTDSSIGLPFTRFKIGVEAIIGLIPGIGDLVGLAMSGYVLLEAQRAGASGDVKRRMLRNIGIDFAVGLVPVFGDAFDAVYKANTRNTRLLRDYLNTQLAVEPPPKVFPWKIVIGLSVLFAGIAGGVAAIL